MNLYQQLFKKRKNTKRIIPETRRKVEFVSYLIHSIGSDDLKSFIENDERPHLGLADRSPQLLAVYSGVEGGGLLKCEPNCQ